MKNLIILLTLFLLTGCNAEYKLNIDEKLNFNEFINMTAVTTNDTNEFNEFKLHIPIDAGVDEYYSFQNKIDTLEYYNIEKNKDSMIISYNFDKDTYLDSTVINNAYEVVSINKNENIVTISTSDEFLLFNNYENLDEVKATITSDYEFISCNADVSDKNECTWIITKDNAYGKNIFLKLDTSKKNSSIQEKIGNNLNLNFLIVILIVSILGLIIYKIIKKKGELNNNI